MPEEELRRGCVFGANHDTTLKFWVSDPKWKRCLLFNVNPPTDGDEAHYFIATASGVNYFRERPHIGCDVLIFSADSYPFFPKETAVDFRSLCIVPMKRLRQMNFRVLGHLSREDVSRCEVAANSARQLEVVNKRLLGLRK